MTFTLMPVVEGDGEVKAVPILLRRICHSIFERMDVSIRVPWRVPRSKMVKPHEIGRVYAALSRGGNGGNAAILVLLDQDDDDVTSLIDLVSPTESTQVPIEIVVACREYEAWFLGGIKSLQSHRSVSNSALFPDNPEAPRDAKGRLERQMTEKYRETLHQPSFTDLLSLSETEERCPSFRNLVEAVGRLVT